MSAVHDVYDFRGAKRDFFPPNQFSIPCSSSPELFGLQLLQPPLAPRKPELEVSPPDRSRGVAAQVLRNGEEKGAAEVTSETPDSSGVF